MTQSKSRAIWFETVALLVLFMGGLAIGETPDATMPPPWGTLPLPDSIRISLGRPQQYLLSGTRGGKFWSYGDVQCISTAEPGEPEASFSLSAGDTKGILHAKRMSWRWGTFLNDRQVFPMGGQVFQWDRANQTLTRIPNHRLAIPAAEAVRLMTIPIDRGLGTLTLSEPQTDARIHISVKRIRHPDSTTNEPGRVELHIFHHNNEIVAPSPSASPSRFWVGIGQYVETPVWYFKVTRIVFPDRANDVCGWVDIRLEALPSGPRPPAPHLPEAPDTIQDDEKSNELRAG